nr:M20 family metallopeptidase [Clostridioides difficile]
MGNINDLNKKFIIDYIDKIQGELREVSDKIWNNPELQYKEYYASNLQKEYLKSYEFNINEVNNMDTAFVASYGEGNPIIAVLGEYDALDGLSQKVTTKKEPALEDGAGHGCGHNLLGTGSMGASIAIKELIKTKKLKGTIKYYGCPAEEDLSGKVVMIKNGCFDGIDCVFSWHPFDINTPIRIPTLANYSVKFRYKGVSAHAAQAPYNGRSALDAVELMNIGCNYLREHIFDSCRVHYVTTNGGKIPNIVPDFAEVWYYIRGVKMEHVRDVFDRIVDIAKGAGLMTGTHMEYNIISGVYDYVPNTILTDILSHNMKLVGVQNYNENDQYFAKKLAETVSIDKRISVSSVLSGNKNITEMNLHDEVTDDTFIHNNCISLSLDIGDVSYITPTAQCSCSVWPIGISAHTWQSCASAGSDMGFKAMLLASKSIACSINDVMLDESIINKAKKELKDTLGSFEYTPII